MNNAASQPGVATTVLPPSPRVPLIESLRGGAALAVLLFHSLAAFGAPGTLHPALMAVRRFTEYGYLGVSIFFAVSGWCIAQRLHSAFHRGESAPVFLLERVLRIFPVYWAALLLALLLRVAALPFSHGSLAANLPETPLAWLGDIFLLQPYLGTSAYVMVSWSLVFELGFYLLSACALAGRRAGCPTNWLLGAGLFACLWFMIEKKPGFLYVLDCWPDFFCGVLAWWIARETHRIFCLAGCAALLLLAGLSPAGFADIHRLTAVGTAVLLVIASRYAPPESKFPKGLAWIGALSYSLYLIHVSILSPFVNLSQRFVPAREGLFVVVWIAALILAVTAGWALHQWIEVPVERWRRALFTVARPPHASARS